MNKRSRPKLSESDLELFNRVVTDVKPLKFQEKSFIDKKNSINRMDKLRKTNTISRRIETTKHMIGCFERWTEPYNWTSKNRIEI